MYFKNSQIDEEKTINYKKAKDLERYFTSEYTLMTNSPIIH